MSAAIYWTPPRASDATRARVMPLWAYRARRFTRHYVPRIALLLATLALYPLVGSPLISAPGVRVVSVSDSALLGELVSAPTLDEAQLGVVAAVAAESATVRAAGHGLAGLEGLDDASRTNIQLAVELLDGTVMEPGAQLSFDDVARTWDFREDPRYLWGWGTSAYGLIHMRGGGVCWVSTALWRAALVAGLRTDFRDNHYGLVHLLGAGSDATNTLVIRNTSTVPVTVRAWVDDDNVNVALFPDGDLERSGHIRGPERLGAGRYVLYQDVTRADGSVTTAPFYSGYFW